MGVLIVSVFMICVMITVAITSRDNIIYSNRDIEKPLLTCSYNSGMFYGGFDDIEGGKNTEISIYRDRLVLFILKKKSNYFDGYSKTLYLDNIKYIGIKSETQIESEVNVGKLVAFGLLAMAMRDRKVRVSNYLLIDYDNGEKIQSIILSTPINEDIVQKVRSLKTERAN